MEKRAGERPPGVETPRRTGCFCEDEALYEGTRNRPTLSAWAGERLGDADLALLKEALALDEWQWHTYKSNVRPAHVKANLLLTHFGNLKWTHPHDGERESVFLAANL